MMKRKKQLATAEELDRFELFLFELDDVLKEFLDRASAAGFAFDYTVDNLCVLEQYIASQPDASADSLFQNRAARYLGEVFRKNVGGKWQLCLTSPRDVYFKLPVIAGFSDKPVDFCPIEVIRNFAAGLETGALKRAIKSIVKHL